MDNSLIEEFIMQQNIRRETQAGYKSRLKRNIEIFEQNGITAPTVKEIEDILNSKLKEEKNKAIALTKEFYKWLEMKGDNLMADNTISNVENGAINQEAVKAGRPVSTARSEKLTLYLTKDTARQLEALRIYDEIELQDLLNEAIQVYFKTRADDLEFLQRQAQARQERKAKRNLI